MKFYEKEQEFVLSTGKKIYANAGILGLSAETKESSLFQGYDSIYDTSNEEECSFNLTQEERKEIAEYMIDLWKEWAHS